MIFKFGALVVKIGLSFKKYCTSGDILFGKKGEIKSVIGLD
jgi:hypothetical protein